MRHLVLLRHAEAEPKDAREDFHRRLTGKGRGQAVAAGNALARLGIRPDRVASSPATRCLETAILAAPALGYDLDAIVAEPTAYRGSLAHLMGILRRHADADCLALVGHNPGLQDLGRQLAALPSDWALAKGAAAVLHSESGDPAIGMWRLVAECPPP